MRIESKLCHFTENKSIVQVTGWINDECVGSALAEGATVELAEDKAIIRLNKRIKITNIDNSKTNHNDEVNKTTKINDALKNNINNKTNDFTQTSIDQEQEPIDWSNDLAKIDLEIKRLGWSREDEINFLKKSLGYKQRNKITNYQELVRYLNILKDIDNNTIIEHKPNNKIELIEESEIILTSLSWDHKRGREYLQKEFKVSSRKELNEEQLLLFINKLKVIQNNLLNNSLP